MGGNDAAVDELLLRIQEIRVNCLIEKKAHYNARERLLVLNRKLGLASVIASAISALIAGGNDLRLAPAPAAAIALLMAAAAAVLSAVQTFLKPAEAAAARRGLATGYVLLARSCLLAGTEYRTQDTAVRSLHETLLALDDRYSGLVRASEGLAPTAGDRLKAKKGIAAGEERYTPEDLAL